MLGFPRRYLASTPRIEIVKHYGLVASLGSRAAISALARAEGLWKLCLITRDRSSLFCRIAGALTCHGLNIVGAEAFANANALVLDTFRFSDDEGHFADDGRRRRFQGFLEDAVEGKVELEPLLRERLAGSGPPLAETLVVELDNESHPSATRLTLNCRDHFGLLYLVSRSISEAGHDIDMAYVETPGQRVKDEFYLTHDGGPLTLEMQQELKARLAHLGGQYCGQDPALMQPGG